MAAMKQVLFVDDETKILDGLKRLLRPMRDRWEMHFEPCAARALERIATGHFDVVVSDMRMPAYTGVDVLAKFMYTNVLGQAHLVAFSPEQVRESFQDNFIEP